MTKMSDYFVRGAIDFLIGFLFGIIYEWNKKILFWIITLSMASLLVAISIYGDKIECGFNLLRFVIGVIFAMIGTIMGIYFYKATLGDMER